jgi:hypothetical protein
MNPCEGSNPYRIASGTEPISIDETTALLAIVQANHRRIEGTNKLPLPFTGSGARASGMLGTRITGAVPRTVNTRSPKTGLLVPKADAATGRDKSKFVECRCKTERSGQPRWLDKVIQHGS